MYPAHYALGMALQTRQRSDRLVITLYFLVGSQFNDLLWTCLTVLGIEGGHSMGSMAHHEPILPWSHSLAMHAVWAVLWALLGWAVFRRDEQARRIAGLGALNVLAHFALDLAVEDMPLGPIAPMMVSGPGLYDRPMVVSFVAEALTITCLWWVYHRGLLAQERLRQPVGSFAALAVMLGLHLFLFLPTFQNVPAVDLSIEPSAVLAYSFFLCLGIALLTVCHRHATRPPQ